MELGTISYSGPNTFVINAREHQIMSAQNNFTQKNNCIIS